MTRGYYAFFDGKIMSAIELNYLVIPSLMSIFLLMVYNLFSLISKKDSKYLRMALLSSCMIMGVTFVIRLIQMVHIIIDSAFISHY